MKKLVVLTAVMMSLAPVAVFGDNIKIETKGTVAKVEAETETEAKKERFMKVEGKIVSTTQGDVFKIMIEDDKGNRAEITVTEDTYILKKDRKAFAAGDEIVVYYDGNLPALMIYPPQYKAVVLATKAEAQNIYVGKFDENLLSSDGSLKVNVVEHTKIVDQDGNEYTGTLADKNLVLSYTMVMPSYPAQVNPQNIVVLDYEKTPQLPAVEDLETNMPTVPVIDAETATPEISVVDVAGMDIVVEDKILDVKGAYMKGSAVMVPFRAIVEALGHEVVWNGETRTISIGNLVTFKVDEDYYTFARMAPINLGIAPEIVDGSTYIPLNFFTQVMQLNNAYVFEGQIVIDNAEKME